MNKSFCTLAAMVAGSMVACLSFAHAEIPASVNTEISQAVAAVDFMAKTWPAQYPAEQRARLTAAADALRAYEAVPTDDAGLREWDAKIAQFRQARRAALFANPLLNFRDIVFLKRHFCPPEEHLGNHMCDQYFGFMAQPGGGLFVLENAFGDKPTTRNLLDGAQCQNGRFQGKALSGTGGFLSPSLSYDGKELLFAYTEGDTSTPYRWTETDTYHLFKVNLDGSGLTQLTDGAVNDIHPCWMPNGRVAFMSERRGGYGRCHGRPVPVYTLHSMNADGSDIVCLSYHESNEWQPSVNHDGMLVYSRWDYVDRGSLQAHHPWITTPDGCDPRAIQGNYGIRLSARPHMELDVRAIPNSRKYIATAAAHHGQAYGSLVMIDPQIEDDDAMAPLTVITPDTGFPESTIAGYEGQRYATAWPLSEQFYLCVYDPQGRAERGNANRYGIYLIDSFGNRELVYSDPEISLLNPIPLQAQQVPPVVPPRSTEALPPGEVAAVSGEKSDGTAKIGLVNVYDSLKPLPQGVKITALRVVEVLSKVTWDHDHPRIGHGSEKNARAVLGTVPVEADGSAFFNAPVHRPLYFQALDENGLAVQSMRSDTYLHEGEMLTCQGCHNNSYRAIPPKARTPAAFRRAASNITPDVEGSRPFNYPRLVQPVLDRACVACHAKEKAIDLSKGDWKQNEFGWSTSYHNLRDYAFFYDNTGWTEPRTTPGQFGARASKLMKILDEGHYDVQLTPEERHRITLWLDCHSDFYGSFLEAPEQSSGEVVQIP